ncbi:Xaa-Pro dipeptidyl-peptidase [Aminipila butyrica]|uniref:Xaa-Pro dipeptidyl-peptidase n=1 Tax=Aminipila butyrica TaxID=433296 RepID=A0A858BTJ4_9FIRM|nr:Xaa-Pro dipeptidyl-peptidase [Aminipila butyrica]QIB68094.1 Xaa-Pro dipeptidyl-peptidase [Aminipila butyrica]
MSTTEINNLNQIPNLIKNNRTQPILDYKECLFEKVYVETPVDTDGDGQLDLIAVYLRRPKETLLGHQIPAIYVANPYMLACNEDWYVTYNVDKDIEVFPQQEITKEQTAAPNRLPLGSNTTHRRGTKGFAQTAETEEIPLECISDWYSYFNCRGYASVFCGGLGTRGSDGLTITGSNEEVLAFKSVIDWLNGRARAFTNKTDNIEIKADWCTGNVAMSGKSYLGTMCIAVAATGVEGLKTIIPEAAISNWYAYDRYNGLNVPPLGWQGDDIALLSKYCCSRAMDQDDYASIQERYEEVLAEMEISQDRASANYNSFWEERNYLHRMDDLKASVFLVQGLNDWNVKMNQAIPFWNQLVKRQIPRRMMLHQGDHIYIHNLESSGFNELLHSWLDYWLYGIENGTDIVSSKVFVQSNLDQRLWQESSDWSPEGTLLAQFPIPESTHKTFTDDLSLTGFDREKNNFEEWRNRLIIEDGAEAYSLKYLWPQEEDLRICGTVSVSFSAAINRETAILSAMLVDYGSEKRLLEKQEIAEKEGLIWGKNTPIADWVRFAKEEKPSAYRIISRGWMNAQNRTSNCCKEEIESGEFYSYTFEMVPMDYTVRKNHQLGLILYSTDPEATERPFKMTKITIDESTIDVQVPCIKQGQAKTK